MKLSEINNPVETLGGIGPATAKQFARLSIFTVSDLLTTYPRTYEDRTKNISLNEYAQFPKVHTICKVTAHDWFGFGSLFSLYNLHCRLRQPAVFSRNRRHQLLCSRLLLTLFAKRRRM